LTKEDLNDIVDSDPNPKNQALEVLNTVEDELVLVGGFITSINQSKHILKISTQSMMFPEIDVKNLLQAQEPKQKVPDKKETEKTQKEKLPEELEELSENHKKVYKLIKGAGSDGIESVDIVSEIPDVAKDLKLILQELTEKSLIIKSPATKRFVALPEEE
jgi:hypothetical protein